MTEKLIFQTAVDYGDIDRRGVMLLPRIFKLLQEAAIVHANQFDHDASASATRVVEAWVLHRIAVTIDRYPRVNETLRVETWSSGLKGFKGYRDFRVYDAASKPLIAASSLWLYLSLKTKSIVRVPRDLAARFPVGHEPVAHPALEQISFRAPSPDAPAIPVSVRYSDFDANEHVNNTAYLDYLQTALARMGRACCPRSVQLHYSKAIPAAAVTVTVRIEPVGATTRFSIEGDGVVFAQGELQE